MDIIGNRFEWDPVTKALVGVKGEVVHTLNKEHSMKDFFLAPSSNLKVSSNNNCDNGGSDNEAILDIHQPRPNVILLGDSLGDARMTMNLDFVANVIKVLELLRAH